MKLIIDIEESDLYAIKTNQYYGKELEKIIANGTPFKAKQDELLDYIKLSLKQSDEFKEKYRNKYKESNRQHDLYYSHLFEGMAEAYDDLLKKMGENEPVKEALEERPRCANCEHYVTDGIPNLYEDCLCVHPEEEYPLDSVLRMKPDDFCSRFEERSK